MSDSRDGVRHSVRDGARDGDRPGRLPYAAAALFIAVLLWAVVRGDQVIERTMTLPLAPALDTGLTLDGERPELRVRVSGRARELLKLGPSSPLRTDATTAEPGAPAHIDLRPGTVELPDGVEATVRDVHPRTVTVRVVRPAVVERTASDRVQSTGKSTDVKRRP